MPVSMPGLIHRYEQLSSAVVYDILDTMRYPEQALSSDITPLAPDMTVAGPAFTFNGESERPGIPKSTGNASYRDVVPG